MELPVDDNNIQFSEREYKEKHVLTLAWNMHNELKLVTLHFIYCEVVKRISTYVFHVYLFGY